MVDDPLDTSDMGTARSRLKRTLGEWRDAGAPTDSLVLLLEGFVACKVAEMLTQSEAYLAQETEPTLSERMRDAGFKSRRAAIPDEPEGETGSAPLTVC